MFRPHLHGQRNLDLGKVLACRVLEDAIDLAAGHVAPPIYIHSIDLEGNVSEVEAQEMTGLEETCRLWRELERETLGKLCGDFESAGDQSVPEPE